MLMSKYHLSSKVYDTQHCKQDCNYFYDGKISKVYYLKYFENATLAWAISTRWSSLTSIPTSDWIVSSNLHKVNTFLTVYVHSTWLCLFRAESIIPVEGLLKFKGGLDITTSRKSYYWLKVQLFDHLHYWHFPTVSYYKGRTVYHSKFTSQLSVDGQCQSIWPRQRYPQWQIRWFTQSGKNENLK